MSSLIAPRRPSRSKSVPELFNGDQLSQREFHRRYEACPEDVRFELVPDTHGVYRSRAFPGLWIDGPALLARDGKRLMRALDAGLASRDHAEFVQRLQSARKRK